MILFHLLMLLCNYGICLANVSLSIRSLTSLHFTSLHFTSLHFTSLHFTSLHFTSLHFTSLHFTSLHSLTHSFRLFIYTPTCFVFLLWISIANQIWCLARNLPLLVGGLIPDDDEHWGLFCDLLEIMRIIFAPTVSPNQVAYLQVLIQNHHEKFTELYPDCSITPKMHYMIHMPRTILRYKQCLLHLKNLLLNSW